MNQSEAGKLGAIASKKTINRLKLERIEAYNLDPKLCKNCDKSISYEKRYNDYCSQSCAAIINNKGKIKNIVGKNGNFTFKIKSKFCPCGQKLENKRNKYCLTCASKGIQHQKIQNFEDAKSDGCRRRFLLRTCPHQCEICKETQWQGQPIPLIMDHIDGDSTNNIRSNFRLVCPNCDAQLPTYKAKNKGKGRHSRRERYKEGKSF